MPASNRRTEEIMDAIKRIIVDEGLRPGDPLPTETRLCEQLGAARTSIREALRQLEALHIVSATRGKGTFVGSLSLDPLVQTLALRSIIDSREGFSGLLQVVEVRRYLDLGCAEQVVANLHGTPQPHLEELVSQMMTLAQEGKSFQDQDIVFHLGLLAATPNMVVKQLIHSLWLVHQVVVPQLGLKIADRLVDTACAHRTLLDAALAGDVDAYRDAVLAHYEPLEEILRDSMSTPSAPAPSAPTSLH